MKKLNCIIADDEPVARKIIREFTAQIPYLELKGEFENAMKADSFLKQGNTDIIFLDIQMPKISGIDWLKTATVKPMVILTTAFPDYALEGYELDIIDYLLKPIRYERFLKAVEKAKDYSSFKSPASQAVSQDCLFVRTDKRIEKIRPDEILYIESIGNYVKIVTSTKSLLVYMTLKGIHEQLASNQFIKIHQSFLVNFSKVSAIEGQDVNVEGKLLPLSRNFKEGFMGMIEERLIRK